AACATTPAERIVQRYLRAGAGVKVTKLPELLGVRPLAVPARNFEHDREMLHVGMGQEDSESVGDQAVADVVVPVEVRAEWGFGVGRMQRAQTVEADAIVHLSPQRGPGRRRP